MKRKKGFLSPSEESPPWHRPSRAVPGHRGLQPSQQHPGMMLILVGWICHSNPSHQEAAVLWESCLARGTRHPRGPKHLQLRLSWHNTSHKWAKRRFLRDGHGQECHAPSGRLQFQLE